jgi:tRNA nucleotidyltransferase (CCA-adding enzyme)
MPKFYVVGGFVRDEILGVKSKDIDFAVEAGSFDEMRQAILDKGGSIFLETPEYLTIRARLPKVSGADFVLCRKDGKYVDGRHPESVEAGTIMDDLARRDFTMNAIAKTEDGEYLDPFNGKADIDARVIRCVGKAVDRFEEDKLRMLRALRFAITKNFSLHQDIEWCLKDPTLCLGLASVSGERIREELHKCFKANTFRTLTLLEEYRFVKLAVFKDNNLWLKPTFEQ